MSGKVRRQAKAAVALIGASAVRSAENQWNALLQLQARIDAQEKRIAELERQLQERAP
jgi:uncharacterized protein YceH (UPF0502 family)